MNSQICDFGDEGRTEDVQAEADRQIAKIKHTRCEIAERRRSLAEPSHKVVVANPTDMHHKITLGGVLVNAGFQACDADALAGLFGIDAMNFVTRFAAAAQAAPQGTMSEIITHLLDKEARDLAGRGLFFAWERRLSAYLDDRAEWLARDQEFRLDGAWRNAPMTADQRWLIRITCRVLRFGMPGHLLRGQAADWLEKNGANLNYGDFT